MLGKRQIRSVLEFDPMAYMWPWGWIATARIACTSSILVMGRKRDRPAFWSPCWNRTWHCITYIQRPISEGEGEDGKGRNDDDQGNGTITIRQCWVSEIACDILTTIRAVWVLTNMSFSSHAAAIRKRSSPKSQVIFAFVFSWIGDFFRIFRINIFKVTASFRFLSLTARGYVQPLTTEHCGSVHYITIGDSRLLTAAGLMRSPLYLIGDAASRCGL